MSAAGIDSHVFKSHSVRGASTTAAANAFVPLSTIMSMADWSSASTFRTFYYNPLLNSDFATGVLSSKYIYMIKMFCCVEPCLFIALSSSVEIYHLLSHIFRTESVKYNKRIILEPRSSLKL